MNRHLSQVRLLSVVLSLLLLISMAPLSVFAAEKPFDDVQETDYYYDSILWAAEEGIAAGTGGGKFFPNIPCIRAQVVTFLWRAMGKEQVSIDSNIFTDVSEDSVYYDAIQWAVANSVTAGVTPTTFAPNDTCTRAQVVTFLWRAMGQPQPTSMDNPFVDVPVDAYYYIPVLWAVENGITAGTSATTFAPNSSCTRGQIVTFLYRTLVDN